MERLLRDGILNDSDVIPTVGRANMGHGWRDVTEYHLTERGAWVFPSRHRGAMVGIVEELPRAHVARGLRRTSPFASARGACAREGRVLPHALLGGDEGETIAVF